MTEQQPNASPNPSADSSAPQDEFTFACIGCGRKLKSTLSMAGRAVRCPECATQQTVTPPASAPQASVNQGARWMGDPSSGATAAPMPLAPSGSAPLVTHPSAVPSASQPMRIEPAPAQPNAPQPVMTITADELSDPYAARPLGQAAPSAPIASSHPVSEIHKPTRDLYEAISVEVAKVFVGQKELIQGTLVALFSNGHVLIESVPGLGKTLFVRTLGRALGLDFGRIQFTADLMPSDITGAPMFDMKTQEFRFRPGPVFTQLLLADEINRSPAKTHAALLEIMQEFRVTVDGTPHELKRPFLVMATQNPIESEGTYNLPEAQLDRFMFKVIVDYPSEAEEARILDLHSRQVDMNEQLANVRTVASAETILETIHRNATVRVDDRLLQYVNRAVRATRTWPQLYMGASPRAGIALMQGARTLAAFRGRDFAVPDDVREIALPALRHRVSLTPEAEVEGFSVDDVLREALATVEVPRL
jgi:MoxR-like ATPase